jgi:hypothetical protein
MMEAPPIANCSNGISRHDGIWRSGAETHTACAGGNQGCKVEPKHWSWFCVTRARWRAAVFPLKTFHNPQKKKILARVLELTLPLESKRQELAPRTGNEERQLKREAGQFHCSPLQVQDAAFAEGMSAPQNIRRVVSVIQDLPAHRALQPFLQAPTS